MSEERGSDLTVGGISTIVVVVSVIGTQNSESKGPTLAFVGAILVALLTAYATSRRQRAQLDHASQENRASREHDRDLKALELDHQRSLNDLDHVRQILDEFCGSYDKALDAVMERSYMLDAWRRAFASADSSAEGDAKKVDALHSQFKKASNAAFRATTALTVASRRLELRFASDATIRTTYNDAVMQLNQIRESMNLSPPIEDSVINAIIESFYVAGVKWSAFSIAAHDLIGSKLAHSDEVQKRVENAGRAELRAEKATSEILKKRNLLDS